MDHGLHESRIMGHQALSLSHNIHAVRTKAHLHVMRASRGAKTCLVLQVSISFAAIKVKVLVGGKQITIDPGLQFGADFGLFNGLLSCRATALLKPFPRNGLDLDLNFGSASMSKVKALS